MNALIYRLRAFFERHGWGKYWETFSYLLFGGLTTVVSFAIYYGLLLPGITGYKLAQVLSWVGAVAFAYFTNRCWVFDSRVRGTVPVLKEAASFAAGRLLTGVIEYVLLWISVDFLHQSDKLMKLIVSVIVVILNYVFSKLFIFRKEKHNEA